jgi:hypothetical protein
MFSSDRVSTVGGGLQPFSPWEAHLHPIVARSYELSEGLAKDVAPAAPEQPVTLTVRERVAYFRYTLEAPNVRLADYAIDAPDEDQ